MNFTLLIIVFLFICLILIKLINNNKEYFIAKPCDNNLTDYEYLKHMIPHHQVAVDMSKRLLLHTNNTYMMEFCRKLIINQQGEIYKMNNLLNNKFNYMSPLLLQN